MSNVVIELQAKKVLTDLKAAGREWDQRLRLSQALLWTQGFLTFLWLGTLTIYWLVMR